ncbi:MAG TPA: LysR family transcriptional regulator, partial [Tabrizicola sp.]|nr:LysR family transcriptional regulator [Tabrizicola sp.]
HHAPVIRHIDALEKRLGAKLFQRHARGYTATEAGVDLLSVAQATDDQFIQLAGRIKGRGESVSGELVVTSIAGIADLLTPVMTSFQEKWPEVRVRLLTDMRIFRLDYGEAHVAIRAGTGQEEQDNVVQPLIKIRNGFYAAQSYVERFGKPASEADLAGHRFVSADQTATRAPFHRWLRLAVQPEQITYAATDPEALEQAVLAGAGIGFLPAFRATDRPGLVEVLPPRDEWDAPLRLVTHVDLHRTRKVQAFVTHLKEAVKGWKLCR